MSIEIQEDKENCSPKFAHQDSKANDEPLHADQEVVQVEESKSRLGPKLEANETFAKEEEGRCSQEVVAVPTEDHHFLTNTPI